MSEPNKTLIELVERMEGYMKNQSDYTQRISDIKDEIYNFMYDQNMTSFKTDRLSVSFRGKSLIVTRIPREM